MKDNLTKFERLKLIADLAHSGGLVGYSEGATLTVIRHLTLPWWDPQGTELEHKQRLMEAVARAIEARPSA